MAKDDLEGVIAETLLDPAARSAFLNWLASHGAEEAQRASDEAKVAATDLGSPERERQP